MPNNYCNYISHDIEAIDQNRAYLKSKDMEIGTPRRIYLEKMKKESFEQDRERINIISHDVLFECIFSNVYRGYDKLYVFFSHGGGRSNESLFHRWTWYRYLPGITIHIEDPMYKIYPNLKTGWFYGDVEHPYLLYLIDFVQKFAEVFTIEKKNIIFIGSSAGGYASLYCGDKIEGSISIAMNPQIRLQKRKDVKLFQETTGISLKEQDKYNRNNLSYILKNTETKFFISVNMESKGDFEVQLPFLTNKLKVPLRYPLTEIRNFFIFLNKIPIVNPHHACLLGNMIPFVEGIVRGDFTRDCKEYVSLFLAESMFSDAMQKEKIVKLKGNT